MICSLLTMRINNLPGPVIPLYLQEERSANTEEQAAGRQASLKNPPVARYASFSPQKQKNRSDENGSVPGSSSGYDPAARVLPLTDVAAANDPGSSMFRNTDHLFMQAQAAYAMLDSTQLTGRNVDRYI